MNTSLPHTGSTCRSCLSDDLQLVLRLGDQPLANVLLKQEHLARPEGRFPLDVARCRTCGLMQVLETVSPEILFCQDYPYYSSVSDALLAHSREHAHRLMQSRNLDAGSLVVELASNDGYMLRNFKEQGIPVLGIDPAEGPARIAQQAGIPTLCTFFGRELAMELRDGGQAADVIIANNVLAHVPDLNGFVEGISILLKEDGVAVIEVPYVRDLIDHCEFDTIYHEHYSYFSVTALVSLFKRHGLSLNHIEHLPIHGGSLRLELGLRADATEAVGAYLAQEAERGIDSSQYYEDFAARVEGIKDALLMLLRELKGEGKRIAAYGAAAKGSTLLNYIGVGTECIDFVVDRSAHKQGMFMPGVHLPIHEPGKLLDEQPDYVLLLTWNFKDEILRQQEEFMRRGGRFIVPVPHPAILDPA